MTPLPKPAPRMRLLARSLVMAWPWFGLVFMFMAGLSLGTVERANGQDPDVPSTLAPRFGPSLPGTAVYPVQQIPLRFDHRKHLALGLDCTRCHVAITNSQRAQDFNFPSGERCDECHGDQHPPATATSRQCELCHTRVTRGRVTAHVRAAPARIKFNHRLHISLGSSCRDCHGDMSKVRLATTAQLPSEATCLRCHDGIAATDRCGACHLTDKRGLLATRQRDDSNAPKLVPRGTSSWGVAHDVAFVEDHRVVAKASPGLCKACHDETFCQDCHNGAIRPLRIHSGDYLTVHAMDARGNTMDCQSCHRLQTFCQGCHERLWFGRRDDEAFGVGSPLRFHPAGWSGPLGTAQGHAHAAQRNLGACVSCHGEDSCLACHATAKGPIPGLDVNPHGIGFRGSPRCFALAERSHRMCLRCHAPGDMMLDCR